MIPTIPTWVILVLVNVGTYALGVSMFIGAIVELKEKRPNGIMGGVNLVVSLGFVALAILMTYRWF